MADSSKIHINVQIAIGAFSILGGALLLAGWFYWATYISMFGLSGLDISPSVHALMFMGLRVVLKTVTGILTVYLISRAIWFLQGTKGRKNLGGVLGSYSYWVSVSAFCLVAGVVGTARCDVSRDISINSRLSLISITPTKLGNEGLELWPSEVIAPHLGDLAAGGTRDLRLLFLDKDTVFLVPIATKKGNEIGAVPRVLAVPKPKLFAVEPGRRNIGWDLLW